MANRYWFSPADAGRTIERLGDLWRQVVSGLTPEVAAAAGVEAVGAAIVHGLAHEAQVEAPVLGPDLAIDVALDQLGATVSDAGVLNDDWAATLVLTASWSPLLGLVEQLRECGAYPQQAGRLVAVNASGGGVPKQALDEGEVTWEGLGGDRQAVRRHHGRPWQALSLWSAEVIDSLRAEGHPVSAGAAGENLTLGGLDWAAVRVGTRVRIGEMACVVSAWAEPCSTIAHCFADRGFRRIHHERGPVSRAYATVTAPGTIRPGDPVIVD